MPIDLARRELAFPNGSQDRRIFDLQQGSGFLDSHHLIARLSQRGMTNHKPITRQVLTHGFTDELALALAGCRDRLLQVLRILVG